MNAPMLSLKEYNDSITISLPESSPSGRYIYLIDFIACMLENDISVDDVLRRSIIVFTKERFSGIKRYDI